MSDDMKYSDDYDIGWEKWIDAYDQTLQDMTEEDFDDDDELDPEDLEALGLDEGLGQMQPMIIMILDGKNGLMLMIKHYKILQKM